MASPCKKYFGSQRGSAMKPKLGTAVTALFMATLTLRPTVIVAAACIALAWATNHHVCAEERSVRIVVLGDSLTAGYGVPAVDAFPAKLEFALRRRGQSAEVANAGVNGDTAARGLARLNRSIPDDTDAVILELGANDMLRGFDPNVTRAALAAILRNLEARPNPTLETNTRALLPRCSLVLPASTMCCSTRLSTMRLWTMLSSSCRTACTQARPESKRSSRAYCKQSRP